MFMFNIIHLFIIVTLVPGVPFHWLLINVWMLFLYDNILPALTYWVSGSRGYMT